MSRNSPTLTVARINAAQPAEKAFYLYDKDGLRLKVMPSGSKRWLFNYRFLAKYRTLALGKYPEVSLQDARLLTSEARLAIAKGSDPAKLKRDRKNSRTANADITFSSIGDKWFAKKSMDWADSQNKKVRWLLEKQLYPQIGDRPIDEITAPELYKVLESIERKGHRATAVNARQKAGQVFRFGITQGVCKCDISSGLKDALSAPSVNHRPAVTDPIEVGRLLKMTDNYSGSPIVQAALKLAPLTFVRPAELRKAEWSEVDLEKRLWTIPAHRMKKTPYTTDLLVPLSRQAIEVLVDLVPITGHTAYLFPRAYSRRGTKRHSPHMSENTINKAMRSLGIPKDKMCGHGYRAMARTLLDERLGANVAWIEQQLAHRVADLHGNAYNRTQHLSQRTQMMQDYADYLDELKRGVTVRPFAALNTIA